MDFKTKFHFLFVLAILTSFFLYSSEDVVAPSSGWEDSSIAGGFVTGPEGCEGGPAGTQWCIDNNPGNDWQCINFECVPCLITGCPCPLGGCDPTTSGGGGDPPPKTCADLSCGDTDDYGVYCGDCPCTPTEACNPVSLCGPPGTVFDSCLNECGACGCTPAVDCSVLGCGATDSCGTYCGDVPAVDCSILGCGFTDSCGTSCDYLCVPDPVFCNPATDCFGADGECYSECESLAGEPNSVCIGLNWVNVNTDATACGCFGGTVGVVGETSADSQYDLEPSKMLTFGTPLCVLPADDYFLRTRECGFDASTLDPSCTDDISDAAICDKGTDCVFGGTCYSDLDVLAASPSLAFGSSRSTAWTSDFVSGKSIRSEVSTDVDADGVAEYCDPGEWQGDPSGDVSGTVVDFLGVPVENVQILFEPSAFSTLTDALGTYSITVPEDTYTIRASKLLEGYEDNVNSGVFIPAFEATTFDMILVKPRLGCSDECVREDGLCYADCQGKGLCNYASEETAAACHLSVPGVIDFEGQQIVCCTGGVFTAVQTNVEVCGDNVVSIRKPVLYKGKLVNMVLTVFNIGECKNI